MAKKGLPRYPWQYKLQDALKKQGIEQKELCKEVGMTESQLSLKIGGYRKITVLEAIRIARVIGMPVEEVFIAEGEAK